MTAEILDVCVLSGDPRLPYEYGVDGRFGPDEVEAVQRVGTELDALPGVRARLLDDHAGLIDALRQQPPGLVLNFCDAGFGNRLALEANVPALLEVLDIPYTGTGPGSMGLCSDKAAVRHLAAAHGIPVPNEKLVDLRQDPLPLPDLYPAMIKPNAGCGSFGIRPDCVVHDPVEADACLRRLATELEQPQVLVQDFLSGSEYTLGLVGNPGRGFTVLPVLEIDYSRLDPGLPPILSYGSKADPESRYWQALRFHRAELAPEVEAPMVEAACFLFERLGLRDYARMDFRAGADGVPRLLDANFNPTWSWDGKMAMMAGWAGHEYRDFLGLIIDAARARYGI